MTTPLDHRFTHIAAVLGHEPEALAEDAALNQARRLARRTGSALTLVAFTPEPTLARNLLALATDAQSPEQAEQNVRQELFELATGIQREDGITVQCEVQAASSSADAVLDWLDRVPTDLLVMNQPTGEPTTNAASDRYSTLIRQTPMPIWFARGDSVPQSGVVAAVEHPDEPRAESAALDYEVVDTARGVVSLFDTDLHLVRACKRPDSPTFGAAIQQATATVDPTHVLESQAERDGRIAAERRSLAAFGRALGAQDQDPIVADGDAPSVINASAAALDAGLIVMGATPKSRWEALLTGGTAESLLARASCDVLFVKSGEFSPVLANALLSNAAMARAPDGPETVDLLVNPRYHFHRPLAVLRSDALERDEKIAVLRCWAEDLREEHQPVARTFQADPGASRNELKEIQRALAQLGAGRSEAA